ncbi:UDP-4-amino-4, 6-dideoxy-N-acetyl-beta-L-altrosamine N-acetyltransferase [Campylobacter majalis]|uniref:UDP-4-amino-4, 6-dideoxy-N-acetyl-beta-L-altrosamine N-acetyltransferase n=1 Tax=Campylobacter majalis TaxID=2790656 RepID=A0ABN7K7R4_9BACT|nr:UDP-4-amino-4,6-dideoxy-N-acetyl-beta-L-altrosamine N-acetyltransferase [Campylobacter majalis]CAD7288029.1 UDP-4-amino-4, 6-dideoxy-N-acetyl-beta-L-altrosamine N-acetyltransferase [Campylobacter majalis]
MRLINFTELSHSQKMMILKWRNDEQVAKFMLNKNISEMDHLNFIQSLKTCTHKLYFLVKNDDVFEKCDIGVIYFTDICKESCEFGLYANPSLKGVGKVLIKGVIDYAFCVLKVKILSAKAYKSNEKALALYDKFGFEICSEDDEFFHLRLVNS